MPSQLLPTKTTCFTSPTGVWSSVAAAGPSPVADTASTAAAVTTARVICLTDMALLLQTAVDSTLSATWAQRDHTDPGYGEVEHLRDRLSFCS